MRTTILLFFVLSGMTFIPHCKQGEEIVVSFIADADEEANNKGKKGKKTSKKSAMTQRMSDYLIKTVPDTLPLLKFDIDLVNALNYQKGYLRKSSTPQNPVPGIYKKQLIQTVETLLGMPFYNVASLADQFDFYRLNTSNKNDKIRITGYYTPILDARKEKNAPYTYPLLRNPSEKVGKDTTISSSNEHQNKFALAWVKSAKEVSNAQLQGSCLIEFPGGEQQFLGFGGSVKQSGGTYVYFKKVDNQVLGAGSFPMTAGYSLAVDPKVVPLGSCLLAELPQMTPSGKLIGYTYRIVLAQDRGGAIKSTRRVDLYSGMGQQGLEAAREINGYGRMWLILPKAK